MKSQSQRSSEQKYLSPEKYLTLEEVRRLRQVVGAEAAQAKANGSRRGLVNAMLVDLMLETGLRAAEVCGLRLEDLPSFHGKNVVIVRQGKGDKMRTVIVKQSFKEKLDDYLKNCRKGAKPNSPLFASEAGNRRVKRKIGRQGKVITLIEQSSGLTYASLYTHIKRLGKQAGIPHLHPHMLRHTFGTHLYAAEKDIQFVARQMGHSNVGTTSRYAGVFPEDAQRQTELLYQPQETRTFGKRPANQRL